MELLLIIQLLEPIRQDAVAQSGGLGRALKLLHIVPAVHECPTGYVKTGECDRHPRSEDRVIGPGVFVDVEIGVGCDIAQYSDCPARDDDL